MALDTVNIKTLAEIVGVCERTAYTIAREGIFVKIVKNKYDLAQSIQRYVSHKEKLALEMSSDSTKSDAALDKEKLKHEKAKREMAELKLAKMRGDVHSSESIELVMTDMLSRFKSKMRAIPVKASASINPTMSMAQITDILSREIDEALTELADYNPELFHDGNYVDIDTAESGDDGQDTP